MKKWIRAGVLVLLLLGLTGCRQKAESSQSVSEQEAEADAGSNFVTVKKDGVIINTIEAAFEASYYEEESLREFALREASDYNAQADGQKVTIKKLEVKKNRAYLTMEYETAEDFSAFNGYPFFCGTVAEAYDAGYDLDQLFFEADKKKDGAGASAFISRKELLEMGSRRIIIVEPPADEQLCVKTSGKILYLSGAKLIKKDVAQAAADSGMTYLIYK